MWIIRLWQIAIVLLSAMIGLWLFLNSWGKATSSGHGIIAVANFVIILIITFGVCVAIGAAIAVWINSKGGDP